jgi:hypothetical protein
MAHFAEIDDEGRVLRVVVVANRDITDRWNRERESLGVELCKNLFGADTRWVQTSYNASFRGKFAGVGDVYDAASDQFISAADPA